jgi:hypothetical protein
MLGQFCIIIFGKVGVDIFAARVVTVVGRSDDGSLCQSSLS